LSSARSTLFGRARPALAGERTHGMQFSRAAMLVHQEGELGCFHEPARFAPADSVHDEGITRRQLQ